MYVDSTTGKISDATSTTSTTKTTTSSSSLDKNAFLQLLCTEMKYQDPLEPMDNTEYISQMANFSALEQMQNLNTTVNSLSSTISSALQSMNFQNAAANVGKTATYTDSSAASKTGTIDSVKVSNGTVYYVINGKEISAASVTSIGAAASQESETVKVLKDILEQLEDMSAVSV